MVGMADSGTRLHVRRTAAQNQVMQYLLCRHLRCVISVVREGKGRRVVMEVEAVMVGGGVGAETAIMRARA